MKRMIEVKYLNDKFRARVYEWRVDRYATYIERTTGEKPPEPDWYLITDGHWDNWKAEWFAKTPEKAYKRAAKYLAECEERDTVNKMLRAFEDGKYEEVHE